MKASKVLLSSNCPYLWCSCGTRKSPRRYKPSHGKIFLKFEKSPRCGGLVQAKINPEMDKINIRRSFVIFAHFCNFSAHFCNFCADL